MPADAPSPAAAGPTRPGRRGAKINHTRGARRETILARLAPLALIIGLCACADQSPPPDLAGGERVALAGPWDFLQAAIAAAQSEHEMATLRRWEPEPGVIVYEMLTITDDRVLIRAETDAPHQPFEPGDLRLEVRYGLFGSEAKGEAVIETIRARLRELQRHPPAR